MIYTFLSSTSSKCTVVNIIEHWAIILYTYSLIRSVVVRLGRLHQGFERLQLMHRARNLSFPFSLHYLFHYITLSFGIRPECNLYFSIGDFFKIFQQRDSSLKVFTINNPSFLCSSKDPVFSIHLSVGRFPS